MDFGLSQDQILLKQTVKRFLTEQCPATRVRQVMESATGHDEQLWAGLMALGIGALVVPAAYGGLERELLDLALVAEELGYAAAPGPFLGTSMATIALSDGGDDRMREHWLTRLASGDAIGTVALGEEDAQWNPERFRTIAKAGKLSGTKPLVPNAAIADFIVVAAKDERGGPGLWLVERGAANLRVHSLQGNDMTRRLDLVELRDTPATGLPNGATALQRVIDAGLILLAADAYGGALRCLEMARSYALQREQFGQPIGAFQAVKHQLANMATELEPCLSLYWYAAHAFDRIKEQSTRHAAIAKAHLTDVFDRAARESTELHGGIGFTWEFDLHLWFRRAIFDRSYLGDAHYQRARAADLAGW
jgi:alkylation response protein AidB-like acyl-CoA dehydrogenase